MSIFEVISAKIKQVYQTPLIGLLLLIIFLPGCEKKSPDFFQGYVEGDYVYISSSTPGTLQTLAVEKGQTVAKGARLFELDPNPEGLQIEEAKQRMQQAMAKLEDLRQGSRPSELAAIKARLNKNRAVLAVSERDYQRRLKLYELGDTDSISKEELDRYQTEVDIRRSEVEAIEADLKTAHLGGRAGVVAAANLEVSALAAAQNVLEWKLGEKQVLAPTAGFVQDTLYRIGEFVPAGRSVISLLPPENLKIRFFIPQARLPEIELGASVRVHFDGSESDIAAAISFISPEAEFTPPVIYSKESRAKLVFMIEAIPDKSAVAHLRVGQPLDIYLN